MPPARRARLIAVAVEHSLVLPAGAIVALVWANAWQESYARFAHALEFAVNDVGMALFFALATKEVVEATAPGGALHTWRRAALPVAAAIGGMIAPALIYIVIVYAQNETQLLRGWAIPCATDIAVSYLVAKAIYREHPAVPFLLLLAVADDAMGVIILAAFYPPGDLHLAIAAALMTAALAASFALRRFGTRIFWPYILVGGALSWVALFLGGLHPALALVPIVPFLPHAARDPGLFVEAPAGADDALSELEHRLKYPVQVVLFLFALVNAGVLLEEIGTGSWAVAAALVAGKPIGIALGVAAAIGLGLRLPSRLHWRDVVVIGFAASIGFTVALFFATAAFATGSLLDETRIGALLSVSGAAAAWLAAVWLRVGRFARPAGRP